MSGDFDAVIIGAGVGGLTCGAYLARAGMRVLVVEKHERVGGYAHAFSRGIHRFDCGIYSVPMGPEGFVRRCLSELGVNCATKFVELPHMCQIRLPGVTFDIPSRKGEFGRMLCERFPKERKHILHLLDYSSLLYQHMVDADFSEYGFLDHAHDFVKEHV